MWPTDRSDCLLPGPHPPSSRCCLLQSQRSPRSSSGSQRSSCLRAAALPVPSQERSSSRSSPTALCSNCASSAVSSALHQPCSHGLPPSYSFTPLFRDLLLPDMLYTRGFYVGFFFLSTFVFCVWHRVWRMLGTQ